MVEDQVGSGRVRQVGGDVARTDLDRPILDILGMHEHDVPDQVELFEQHGADQPVEIAPGHQPISLHRHRHSSVLARRTPLFLVGGPLQALDRRPAQSGPPLLNTW
jgi:hypothetical protein